MKTRNGNTLENIHESGSVIRASINGQFSQWDKESGRLITSHRYGPCFDFRDRPNSGFDLVS